MQVFSGKGVGGLDFLHTLPLVYSIGISNPFKRSPAYKAAAEDILFRLKHVLLGMST
jgi:hypothetical protein